MINFIMGVATGSTKNFNWYGLEEYSVCPMSWCAVGLEALLAFFRIAIGIWSRLGTCKPRVHLAALWLAVLGCYSHFILAPTHSCNILLALNSLTGAPNGGFLGCDDQPDLLLHFPHTIFGALAVAGSMLLGTPGISMERRKDGIDTVDEWATSSWVIV